jgi:metallophosphoesterase (TIGR00282 family)
MKILMIGDVVGSPGRKIFEREVPRLKKERGIDAVVVNAENCAAGSGITAALSGSFFDAGADAITLGDHTWGQKEFAGQIGSLEKVIRPVNFPQECPGRGWCMVTMPTFRFAVVNVQGRVFMNPVDCPFKAMDRALNEIPKDVPVFVDFHAEATSEKITLGYYLDGRVTAIVGTHTHVQTADEQILPRGTGFLTDVGMSGPTQSVLGICPEQAIAKMKGKLPVRFSAAPGETAMNAVLFTLDDKTGKTIEIERLTIA